MSFSLYLITPDASEASVAIVEAALEGAPPGAVAVRLRDPSAEPAELERAGRRLAAITSAAGAALFVTDDPGLARRVGAAGVHLTEGGPPVASVGGDARVGCSRHDRAGLVEAAAAGASFALLSPIAAVDGKGAPLGVAGFARMTAGLALPVYALGGVTPALAPALRAEGAAGVAVIRAVFGAPDPAAAVAALLG